MLETARDFKGQRNFGRRALLRRNFRRLTTASASRPGNGAIDYDEFTKILLAERTTRFAPVSGGGGFLGVSPA